MYEQHFGLTKRPFSAQAKGTEVFVGPQTAKTMAGFRKALTVQDSVVTVSGAVGTGKTTLVERALDAIGSKYKTIRVGRMQMNASDVLESLLIVLGVKDRPSGTIQRFTALRKKLKDLEDADTRVFILVEDALRAGAETLAELEALTVGDAGESDGASIVLMGDERLFDFMKDPRLAQLQQRIRQRHRIKPLCVAELRGYLKHSLRMAGSDYDQIFDARSADLVHELSEGIPRVANTLMDAVLVAAANQGVASVPSKMIADVASEEFGLSVDNFDFSPPVPDDEPVDVAADAPAPVAVPDVAAAAEPAADDLPELVPAGTKDQPADDTRTASESPDAIEALADDVAAPPEADTDVPHLIHDTLPDLAILSKRYETLALRESNDTEDSAAGEIPELRPETATETTDEAAQADAPVLDVPELTEKASPRAEPKWELAKEPEFELVTEVVPALEVEPAAEPAVADDGVSDGIPELKVEPNPETIPELAVDPTPASRRNRVTDDIPELQAEPTPDIVPELVAEPEPAGKPDLTIEATPEPAQAAAAEAPAEAEPAKAAPAEADSRDGSIASKSQPESAEADVPEWDRDPTLAELKPDLDALEQAMAFAHGDPLPAAEEVKAAPEEIAQSVADDDEVPEIILDKSIETGIENLDVEEPSDIVPPTPAKKSDPELDRIAADIANAKSLEDIDDIMAETLFGTGISMIAAQLTANPPPDDSANDELKLVDEPQTEPAPAAEEKAAPVPQKKSAPARSEISEEISIETSPPVANTGLDLSASQRLKTVRALNADLHPSLREPKKKAGKAAPAPNGEPEPIEDQINTSITQTLKALKVPPEMMEDEPEEEPKKGFLSRFRRS